MVDVFDSNVCGSLRGPTATIVVVKDHEACGSARGMAVRLIVRRPATANDGESGAAERLQRPAERHVRCAVFPGCRRCDARQNLSEREIGRLGGWVSPYSETITTGAGGRSHRRCVAIHDPCSKWSCCSVTTLTPFACNVTPTSLASSMLPDAGYSKLYRALTGWSCRVCYTSLVKLRNLRRRFERQP